VDQNNNQKHTFFRAKICILLCLIAIGLTLVFSNRVILGTEMIAVATTALLRVIL